MRIAAMAHLHFQPANEENAADAELAVIFCLTPSTLSFGNAEPQVEGWGPQHSVAVQAGVDLALVSTSEFSHV